MNATRITHAIIFGEAPTGTRLKYTIPARKVDPSSETVQTGYYENGEFVLEECDHAGAELEVADSLEFDGGSGGFLPTGSESVLVCDKKNCQAVYNPLDGKWETR